MAEPAEPTRSKATPATKFCPACEEEKPRDAFAKWQRVCRDCQESGDDGHDEEREPEERPIAVEPEPVEPQAKLRAPAPAPAPAATVFTAKWLRCKACGEQLLTTQATKHAWVEHRKAVPPQDRPKFFDPIEEKAA